MTDLANKNIKPIIAHAGACEAIGKNDKPYRYFSITLTNGFEKRIFLDRAEWFAVDDAIRSMDDTTNLI